MATEPDDKTNIVPDQKTIGPVTEENLSQLDKKLWNQAYAKNADDDSKSAISGYTATSCFTARSKRQPSVGKAPSVIKSVPYTPTLSARGSGGLSARGVGNTRGFGDLAYVASQSLPSAEPSKSGFDWSTLDKVAAKMHEKDLESQRLHEKELQLRLQEDLKKQVADFHLKGAREKDEDRYYFDMQEEAVTNWKAQEEADKRRAREKAILVQKHRNFQMQSSRFRKEEERRIARFEAQDIVNRVKKENELDEQETEHRRQLRRELVQKALDEGLVAKQCRDENLRVRTAAEESSIEEYRRRITDRVQQSQEDRWQKVSPMRQIVESQVSSRLLAEQEKIDMDNLKVDKEIAEKDAKAEAAIKASREKLKKERFETQQYLLKQIELKKEGQQKEQKQKQDLGNALERDAKRYVDTEMSRNVSQRERAFEHRSELEKQIAAKMCSPKRLDTMSTSEAAMNRRLIERVSKFEIEEGSVVSPR